MNDKQHHQFTERHYQITLERKVQYVVLVPYDEAKDYVDASAQAEAYYHDMKGEIQAIRDTVRVVQRELVPNPKVIPLNA